MNTQKYMSVKHTAEYLDAPVSTVYEWIQSGEIPQVVVVRLGGRILLNRERLDAHLDGAQGVSESLPNTVRKLYNSIQSNPAYRARKG